MKGFKLDNNGDVLIKSNKVVMTSGKELLRQTIESVIGTNKGEWPLNPDEGITFSNILGKNVTDEMIKFELQEGLTQVDNTFTLTSFELENLGGRKFKVIATAQNAEGAELGIGTSYGSIEEETSSGGSSTNPVISVYELTQQLEKRLDGVLTDE